MTDKTYNFINYRLPWYSLLILIIGTAIMAYSGIYWIMVLGSILFAISLIITDI